MRRIHQKRIIGSAFISRFVGGFTKLDVKWKKLSNSTRRRLIIMTDIAEIDYFPRDFERAEHGLNQVLETDPNFFNARVNLVKVRYKRGASYFLESAEFEIFGQEPLRAEGQVPNYDLTEMERMREAKNEKRLREIFLKSGQAAVSSKPEANLTLARYCAMWGKKKNALDALQRALDAKSRRDIRPELNSTAKGHAR